MTEPASAGGLAQPTGRAAVLAVSGLVKRFGATTALAGVSLRVHPGSVHVLVGHNGSGKSTLIKILSGYHRPDAGTVEINQERVRYPTNASAMRQRGLHVMHQDIGLAPGLSVLENLRITEFETATAGRIRWRRERAQADELLARFSVAVSPDALVRELSPTERAIIGVVRAFQSAQRRPAGSLVVLDEPTAFLPRNEVDRLFQVIHDVARLGCGVLLVTHHVDEPFRIGDTVTVLRNGSVAASRLVRDISEAQLIRLIAGGDLQVRRGARPPGQELLRVGNLRGGLLGGVSFAASAGEVLGLTGLAGEGYDSVLRAVFGAEKGWDGQVTIAGHAYVKRSPPRSVARAMSFLPADRQRAGGIMRASVHENITLPVMSAFRNKLGRLDRARERSVVADALDQFGIIPRRAGASLLELSGGNQQKVLLARWLGTDPAVLLLHEPTQGIDIGAAHEVMEILSAHAARGRVVIVASNQYEDLARMCTRVLVFRSGRIAAEFRAPDLAADQLLAACYSGGP